MFTRLFANTPICENPFCALQGSLATKVHIGIVGEPARELAVPLNCNRLHSQTSTYPQVSWNTVFPHLAYRWQAGNSFLLALFLAATGVAPILVTCG